VLKPANDAHSIKAVAFVCEFDRELSPAGIEHVLAASKRFRSKLLLKQALHTMTFQMQGGSAAMPVPTVGGYRFFTKAPDDTDKVWFEAAGNRIAYCTSEYYSFESFLTDALYFASLGWEAQSLAGGSLIRASLEYRDEFKSGEVDWEPNSLFREKSRFIAGGAVVRGALWHSHCGFYSEDQTLNNIRIEHVSEGNPVDDTLVYKAVITLTHTLNLPSPIVYSDSHESDLKEVVRALRAKHKHIFPEILSDAVLAQIGFQ
jgi:uncharacterized protein (TIGR04255 family)